MTQTKIYYTDAGTANNGKFGSQKTFIVITDSSGKVIHEEKVGDKTNNEGEALAVIWAMENLRKPLHIMSDSRLIVGWASEGWKTKIERLKPLVSKLRFLGGEDGISIEWIPREFNLAGHYIENKYGL